MRKQELKNKLMKRMVYFAENFYDNFYIIYPKKICGKFKEFKPSVSDKLIFSRIIDKHLDNIYEEFIINKNSQITENFIAFNLLIQEYFFNYNWCDYSELAKNK